MEPMPNSRSVQNLANHTRLDPLFHFFALPVLILTFLATIVREVRAPSYWRLWSIVAAAALLVTLFLARTYAIKVQDRVIRLEERLRLTALANDRLRVRIPELTEGQLIALRFASDSEVATLAERALNEKLSAKQIKSAIQSWRPDYWRV